jgi:hypothetical protein
MHHLPYNHFAILGSVSRLFPFIYCRETWESEEPQARFNGRMHETYVLLEREIT